MVYFDVRPLGDLLKEFFEQHRGSDYLDEITVINSWPKVVGPFIASHTIDLSIKNGVLFGKRTFTGRRASLARPQCSGHKCVTDRCAGR